MLHPLKCCAAETNQSRVKEKCRLKYTKANKMKHWCTAIERQEKQTGKQEAECKI